MALPDNVEHYATPMGRVNLEVHHQPTGKINYWLFASVAAIELQEEDIGPLGELLAAYDKEVINRSSTIELWLKRILLTGLAVFVLGLFIQGALN